MNDPNLAAKAKRLLELHHGPPILVLANVWDAASARLAEEAGFAAIATTSAGIANSLGYADGQRVSREEMLESVGRIARAVSCPVTADMEAGYGTTPKEMEDMTRAVIAAGAVGLNLEDSQDDALVDVSLQKEKIQAILETATSLRIPLVLNARTDIYLLGLGDPATRFARTVQRLNAFHEAGAQCLFAPGVKDPETIGRLAREVNGPLNILAVAGSPSIRELEQLGVARASVGSGPMRATLGLLKKILRELREEGTYAAMTEGALHSAEANRLFRK